MPDPSREIQRYLNQPLDDLMQEFDLYAEGATGTMKGPGAAWEQSVPARKKKICGERRLELVRTVARRPLR